MKIKPNEIDISLESLEEISYEKYLESGFANIESSSFIAGKTVVSINEYTKQTNDFLLMLQLAFNQHKAIKISPDNIWLLICQGIASCMKEDKSLFEKFKLDQNKKETLSVRRDDFVIGQVNPWEEIFPMFTNEISKKIGNEFHENYTLSFSTSSTKEISAFEIALMDTMSNYFVYEFASLCGIPEIELSGTKEDYMKMKKSIIYFKQYNLSWWLQEVEIIIDNFINAFEGIIDNSFWNSIFKENNESGGPFITGWITKLFPIIKANLVEEKGVIYEIGFPYMRTYLFKEFKEQKVRFLSAIARNPIFQNPDYKKLQLDYFGSGINKVPFIWKYLDKEIKMNFVSGFIGITQVDNSLCTEINWVVEKM